MTTTDRKQYFVAICGFADVDETLNLYAQKNYRLHTITAFGSMFLIVFEDNSD